jgi:WW domain-binding protein 4
MIYLFLQYWVSQGNKWCDQCKIFIANNPLSIRTHEQGQRHKDNVTKKLAAIRKENAAKEKEKEQAIKALAQIEAVRLFNSFYFAVDSYIAGSKQNSL